MADPGPSANPTVLERVAPPPPAAPLARHTRIDNFRVIRLIGRGGMGEVYLAQDIKLGRRVALKLVNPEQLGSDEAKERFFFEARATARFNHENIVTIYSTGEHDGRPYVALEYVEGQTLSERLYDGDLSAREAARIGLAIARALAEAHRHNLLHRDLKPDNVLISLEGVVRVVDFGLAKVIDRDRWRRPSAPPQPAPPRAETETVDDPFTSLAAGVRGTPQYMAPEQWLGVESSGATDVWALGLILGEMVTGRRPYEDVSRDDLMSAVTSDKPVPALSTPREVPEALTALIARCLAKQADVRPSAEELVDELTAIVTQPRGSAARHDEQELSPFPGLLPFDEARAALFFGRDDEVAAFVERLRRACVLPVVGPSGVGKSSFVRAGVLPRLRERGACVLLAVRPGEHPLELLSQRLLGAARSAHRRLGTRTTSLARSGATASLDSAGNLRVQPPSTGPQQSATPQPATPADWPETPRELAETIRQSPTALGLWLSRCAELAQARVVLFVDQLEELFTMCADRAERTAFLEAVARAAEDPQEPVRVIYTARDDFLVELASTPRSRAALRNLVVLRKPSKQALAETIAGPLRAVGYSLDDSKLAEQMVNEVEGAAAALPLLQFTARMMWERRDKRARMLTRESYEAIGGVAGALATHADGVLAGLGAPDRASARALLLRLVSSNGTRRSVRREQLLDGLDAASALDRLIEARLLVTHPDDDGGEPRVELAHEALIDSWATLSRWVRDSENERAVLLELEQAAELWRKRGADEDAVWRGAALSDARRAIEGAKVPELVERFVAAGEAREARLRGRRRLFGGAVIAVLALGALTATVAAIAFARSETRARRAQRVAERQRANARRESAESALSRGRVLEARARLRASLETLDSTSSRALFARLERDPRRFIKRLPASAYDVAISPSGKRVAVAGQDSTIYVIDAQTGSTRTLRGQRDQLQSVAFAPDGKQLAVATRAGEVALFSLADDSRRILAERGPAERRVVFSPDGKLLAAGGWDGVIRLFDTRHAGAAPRELKGHEDRVYGLVFTPDGRYIASASYDRTLRLFSVADGKERARVDRAHDDRIFDLAIDPSGERLASAGWDQTVREWRLVRPAGGEPRIVALHVLSGHHSGVTSVAYAGRGGLLVSGSADRTVRLWDRNGNARGVLSGHQAGVASVAYAGGLLATASFDKTVRLWRPSVALRARAIGGHSDRVNGVAFSPDGTQVASASSDETVRLWDVATGTPQMLLRGHDDGVITVAFSHDGKRLASASWDESIALWDAARGSRQRVLIGHGSEARSLAFSRDDKLLLSGGYDRTIRLWQASSGAQVASFEAHGGGVRSVALSPDGKLIASGGGDGRVRLWRLATRKLERVVIAHKSTVTAVAFLPSGTKVLSASYDRTLRLTDLAADKTRIVGKHRSRAMTLAVHPSGRVFASGGADGQLLVWSLAADARPRPIARLRAQRRSLNSLDFARDGKKLVSGSDDGTVRVYDVALLAGDDARVTPAWRALTWQRDKGVAPALRSHRGFIWSPPAQVLAAAQPWIARAHTVREAHGALCLLTTRDAAGKRAVELWRGGKRELSQAIDDARDVHRFASGCVVLDGDRAVIVRGGGFQRQLIDHARAIAVGEDGKLYVATDRAVHIYAKNASALRRLAVPRGVSALAPIARGLAIGYESGNIGVASFGSDSRSRSRSTVAPFGQTPASRVTTIAAGPRETLVVGYESGLVGLWRQRGGARLDHSALHGAIAMLAQQGGKLYVASELGDHAVIDLSIYQLPYCALMRRVWQSSPLVADRTRLLRRAAPREHRCAPSR